MYHFSGFTEAKLYLESLGFTLSQVFTTQLPNAKNASMKANLYRDGGYIGYIESPTDILPDEDWVVEISYADKRKLAEGLLLELYGDINPAQGWDNRYFFKARNTFNKIKYGPELEYDIDATSPKTIVNVLVDTTSGVKLLPLSSNSMQLSLDLPVLANQLRYAFADLMDSVAVRRITPTDIDSQGIPTGYVLSVDNQYRAVWMNPANVYMGTADSSKDAEKLGGELPTVYLKKNELFAAVSSFIANNLENGITVFPDNGKINFGVDDFKITLTGDVTGTATVSNLNDVSIVTTVVDISHNHDDKYIKLLGDNYFTGLVSGTKIISGTGSSGGIYLAAQAINPDSIIAKMTIDWDDSKGCNVLKFGTTDVTTPSDALEIYSGKSISLTSQNIIFSGNVSFSDSVTLTGTDLSFNGEDMILNGTSSLMLSAPSMIISNEIGSMTSEESLTFTTDVFTISATGTTSITTSQGLVFGSDIENHVTNQYTIDSVSLTENLSSIKVIHAPVFEDYSVSKKYDHDIVTGTIDLLTISGNTFTYNVNDVVFNSSDVDIDTQTFGLDSTTMTINSSEGTTISSSDEIDITSTTNINLAGNVFYSGSIAQFTGSSRVTLSAPLIELYPGTSLTVNGKSSFTNTLTAGTINNAETLHFAVNNVDKVTLTNDGLNILSQVNTPKVNGTTKISFTISNVEKAYVDNTGIVSPSGSDLVEAFDTSELEMPNNGCCMIMNEWGKIIKSNDIGSKRVIGLISYNGSLTLGTHSDWNKLFVEESKLPIGIAGTLFDIDIYSKNMYDAGELLISGPNGALIPLSDYPEINGLGKVIAKTLTKILPGHNRTNVIIWRS